ncbi:MAG: InlB B-repeat-containing protein [Lachnospiraceae bacterium]|nr:InlB B-repeat-containing protein [Lachnospiraceae bacterium]
MISFPRQNAGKKQGGIAYESKISRLWSILLALVMVVGLLPTTARAEGPATEKANFADDPAAALALINAAKTGEADSTWDSSTNTLTLNGVNFTTTAPTAVKLPETATIVLNGDNTITGGDAASKDAFGIYASGDLTIEGTGTLTATCGAANDDSHGIFARGNMSITGHTITFDANGGTGYMEAATGGSTAYILPANGFTAPDGKPFNCWIVNGTEQAPGAAIDITADTTVTAAWAYTVSFDANGGTGEMTDETGVFGEYTLPENGFAAPEGKQFKGWAASADGEVISGAAIPLSADTILYAIWEDIPVVPAEYAILDGANSNWTLDSGESLSIRGSGEFSQFVGVKVDGTLVDAENYTVEEDSPIVTLKADYLNTLTAGSHTIELEWTDGSASTAFTVHAPAADNETQSSQPGGSRLWIWVALVVVIGAGGLGIVLFGKKKKYSAR